MIAQQILEFAVKGSVPTPIEIKIERNSINALDSSVSPRKWHSWLNWLWH
jgi:hypothetical protein